MMFKKLLAGFCFAALFAACPAEESAPAATPQTPAAPAAPAAAPAAAKADADAPQSASAAQSPAGATEDEEALYALGFNMGFNIRQFDLNESEQAAFKKGFMDSLVPGAKEQDMQVIGPKIQKFAMHRNELLAAKNKKLGEEYLEKAASEPNAEKTKDGYVFQNLTEGTGATPVLTDRVKVHYTGTLIDGTKFDSSYDHKGPSGEAAPATFPLMGVIKCWSLGLQKMKVGGQARLVCPAELAYGDRPRPKIPGGSTLVFDVELLEIVTPPPQKPLPTATDSDGQAAQATEAPKPNPVRPIAPTGPGGIPQNPPGQPQWRK